MGTHDREEAIKLLEDYFELQGYANDVHTTPVDQMVDEMKKLWVNRHDNSYDEESWDDHITSETESRGWTPMLHLIL